MSPQDTEVEITTQFPGLRVRPIGPGDDIVVSAQVLEDWLATHETTTKTPEDVREYITIEKIKLLEKIEGELLTKKKEGLK